MVQSREIKIEVLFELHNKDFTKSISKHYTSVDRLIDGKDCFDYANVKVIAKRQFTGMKDLLGNDIYEGDIVRVLFTDWPSQLSTDDRSLEEYKESLSHMFTIEFNGASFCLVCPSHYDSSEKDYRDIWCGKHGYIEIIGNIHENTELIPQ